jgi:sulfate transport system permease protein
VAGLLALLALVTLVLKALLERVYGRDHATGVRY